jgi:hypothetical protein
MEFRSMLMLEGWTVLLQLCFKVVLLPLTVGGLQLRDFARPLPDSMVAHLQASSYQTTSAPIRLEAHGALDIQSIVLNRCFTIS